MTGGRTKKKKYELDKKKRTCTFFIGDHIVTVKSRHFNRHSFRHFSALSNRIIWLNSIVLKVIGTQN